MGIVYTCCCRYTVRRGSYICAIYTFVYFILFISLALNVIYEDTNPNEEQTLLNEEAVLKSKFMNTTVGISTSKTNMSSGPQYSNNSLSNITSAVEDEPYTDSNTDQLLLLTDVVIEIAGMFSSIAVIVGLYKERRNLLLPWIIVLPIHIVIDVINYGTIAVVYLVNPEAQPQEAQWDVFPVHTVVPGLVFNCINVYAYIVIFSQFQEYCAGRGTAAYEALLWQNETNLHFGNANTSNTLQMQQQNPSLRRLSAERRHEQQLSDKQKHEEIPRSHSQSTDEQRLSRRPSAQFCQKQVNRNQDKRNRRGSGRESIELSEMESDVGTRLCVRFDCEPSFTDTQSTQSHSQSSSSHCISQAPSSSNTPCPPGAHSTVPENSGP